MGSYYDEYQWGQGRSKIFIGSPYQRGHGIGSFLGGLFRRILPILIRGSKTIGKEAAKTGAHIVTDIASHNIPLKTALRTRIKESAINLKRKADEKIDKLMEGSGYKRRKVVKTNQSKTKSSKRRIKKRRGAVKNRKRNNIKRPKRNRKISLNKKKTRKLEDIFAR